MYSKNPNLSEIENYRFFLDFVYKKITKWIYHNQYFTEKSPDPKDHMLYHYFDLGKRVYQLIPKNINFDEFYKNLDYTFIYYPNYVNRYREAWYLKRNNPEFREKLSFIKNSSVIKEKVDNSNKQAWREETGLVKDKSRYYGKHSYKTFSKKHSNRCFRRDETRCLKAEKYDELFSRKVKLYFDPWDWD